MAKLIIETQNDILQNDLSTLMQLIQQLKGVVSVQLDQSSQYQPPQQQYQAPPQQQYQQPQQQYQAPPQQQYQQPQQQYQAPPQQQYQQPQQQYQAPPQQQYQQPQPPQQEMDQLTRESVDESQRFVINHSIKWAIQNGYLTKIELRAMTPEEVAQKAMKFLDLMPEEEKKQLGANISHMLENR